MTTDSFSRRIGTMVLSFGFDPRRFWAAAKSVMPFLRAYFSALRAVQPGWPIEFGPALGDRSEGAGSARGHYFHMDLWAARKVFNGRFQRLVDVGSRIDGYVAHILTFRDVEIFDVRPLESDVPGITFTRANMVEHEQLPANYADCVSCLHALEHFGLGRYGDPIDFDGWKKGLAGLAKILKSDGTLLLAVPIGHQRIEFDAHRVFNPETVISAAADLDFELIEFSMVGDDGSFVQPATVSAASGLSYGCGCFEFRRSHPTPPRSTVPEAVRDVRPSFATVATRNVL